MSFRTAASLCALVCLAAALSLFATLQTPQKPCGGHCNVILVVIDALSAEHIGVYGYDRDTMPLTTKFFKDNGQIFMDASSIAPWTFESFSSMYFSDVPSHIAFVDLIGTSERPNVFSTLRDAAINVRGINLVNTGNFILDGIYAPILADERVIPHPHGAPAAPTKWSTLGLTLGTTRRTAEAFATSGTPFLTFTHVLSVHDPYDPTGDFEGRFASSTGAHMITAEDLLAQNAGTTTPSQQTIELYRLRYDQGIAETDGLLGTFLSLLTPELLQNTAVIVTADHGEAFYDHGHLYHGLSLHRSETHVPLFIYVPGLPPGHINEPVSLIDLAPTILDLEGVAAPDSFKGVSLLPMMEKGTWPTPRALPMQNGYPFFLDTKAVATHRGVPATLADANAATSARSIMDLSDIGVRFGAYVLMGKPGTSSLALYDVATDPTEHHDLSAHLYTPALFDTYLTMLAAYRALAQ